MPGIQSRTVHAAVAMALAAAVGPAHAQSTTASNDQPLEQIVVLGQIIYRDRVETTPPVLEYGLDYFQRFEPLTVGDMLKRVPSVAFLSDVLEFDAVRLRGLDAGYTQILINGRKTPGSRGRSVLLRRPHPRRAHRSDRDRAQPECRPHRRRRQRRAQHRAQGGPRDRRWLSACRRPDVRRRRVQGHAGRRLWRRARRLALHARGRRAGTLQPQGEEHRLLRRRRYLRWRARARERHARRHGLLLQRDSRRPARPAAAHRSRPSTPAPTATSARTCRSSKATRSSSTRSRLRTRTSSRTTSVPRAFSRCRGRQALPSCK